MEGRLVRGRLGTFWDSLNILLLAAFFAYGLGGGLP